MHGPWASDLAWLAESRTYNLFVNCAGRNIETTRQLDNFLLFIVQHTEIDKYNLWIWINVWC